MSMTLLAKYLPILDWGRTYDRGTLTNDLVFSTDPSVITNEVNEVGTHQ